MSSDHLHCHMGPLTERSSIAGITRDASDVRTGITHRFDLAVVFHRQTVWWRSGLADPIPRVLGVLV